MLNQSPLETLASYAIIFIAGVASVVLVEAYGKWMKGQGQVQRSPEEIERQVSC